MSTMTTIEKYISLGQYNGSLKSYYKVVEECVPDRTDDSVLKLVEHLSITINPMQHLWLTNLYNLLHKYFLNTNKIAIRLRVLAILTDIFKLHR